MSGTVRVGTSGWSYPSWVGSFYPEGTTSSKMLGYLASRLSSVEAHSTHRRFPTPAALERWARSVPDGFELALKAHAGITHRRDIEGLPERVTAFLDALEPLGDRRGPLLYSLPHRRPDLDRLEALLSAIPAGSGPVFELDAEWRRPEVEHRLEAAGAGLAVVERDGDDPAEPLASGPVYVRLRRTRYTVAELDRWAGRLLEWTAGGRAAYAYVMHDEAGQAPLYARRLVESLERQSS